MTHELKKVGCKICITKLTKNLEAGTQQKMRSEKTFLRSKNFISVTKNVFLQSKNFISVAKVFCIAKLLLA